jgi:hypothetical protein
MATNIRRYRTLYARLLRLYPRAFRERFGEGYNADTGHSWTSSYFVASPDGIRELLERENWQYANTGNVILVKRYDPKVIRQAVLEDMVRYKENARAGEE